MKKLKSKLTPRRIAIVVISIPVVALAILVVFREAIVEIVMGVVFIIIFLMSLISLAINFPDANGIRADVLVTTPLGMHMEDVHAAIDKHEEWTLIHIDQDGGFWYRGFDVIGNESIKAELGRVATI